MYEILLVNLWVNFVSGLRTLKPKNFFLNNLGFSSPESKW